MIIPIRKGGDLPGVVFAALGDPRLGGLTQTIWTVAERLLASTKGLTRPQYRRLGSGLVYCLQDDLGGGSLIPLNRGYKPLGEINNDWIDYRAKAYNHLRLRKDAVDLSHLNLVQPKGRPATFFFFNNSNPPWRSRRHLTEYWDRLCLVAGLVQTNVETDR